MSGKNKLFVFYTLVIPTFVCLMVSPRFLHQSSGCVMLVAVLMEEEDFFCILICENFILKLAYLHLYLHQCPQYGLLEHER